MGSWNLISFPEALRRAGEAVKSSWRKTESVKLPGSLGRIAAVDIPCMEDNPAFNRSTVDGYAVSSRDTCFAAGELPVDFSVTGEVRMGQSTDFSIAAYEALRIPTGGMLPSGADCVVMQEHVERLSETKIRLYRPLQAGENIVMRGDDAIAGSVIVPAGHKISVADLGVLASCGVVDVPVVKKPVVAIITTGDEVIAPEMSPGPGQVRDVNSYTLSALAYEAGCEVHTVGRVPDRPDVLADTLAKAVAESEFVLVSGGSSVGDRDFTAAVVANLTGAKLIFHGIAIKPGKPTLMAMVGQTAVFGIPGHAVAAMTIFAEIVAPVIRTYMGVRDTVSRYRIKALLGNTLVPDSVRDEIVRVRLEKQDETIIAHPLPSRSGLITTMSRAHGLIYLQAGQPALHKDAEIEVQLLENSNGILYCILREDCSFVI